MCISRFGLGVCSLAVFAYSFAIPTILAVEPSRTWTDNTGERKVQASLLECDGKNVQLQRIDGRSFSIPISKLSKADQEYLRSNYGVLTTRVSEPSDKGDAAVVLVRTDKGRGSRAATGFIAGRDAKRAYVLVPIDRFIDSWFGPDDRYQIEVRIDGKIKRVDAQWLALSKARSAVYLGVTLQGIPALPPLAAEPPAVGQPVRIVGHLSWMTRSELPYDRVAVDAHITNIRAGARDDVLGFELEKVNERLPRHGIVFDSQGQTLGVLSRLASKLGNEEIFTASSAKSTLYIQRVLEPQLEMLEVLREGKAKLRFVAYLSDPASRFHAARLHVREYSKELATFFGDPQPDDISGGLNIPDAQVLELARADLQLDPRHVMFERDNRWKTAVAEFNLDHALDDGIYRCFAQLELVDANQHSSFFPVQNALWSLADDRLRQSEAKAREKLKEEARAAVVKTLNPEGVKLPQPDAVQKQFAGNTVQANGNSLTRLQIDATTLVDEVVWSSDGRWIYLLHRNGILRKVAVPSWEQELELNCDTSCTSLAACRKGLVVIADAQRQAMLIDMATLVPQGIILTPPVTKAFPSPGAAKNVISGRNNLYVADWDTAAFQQLSTQGVDSWTSVAASLDASQLYLANGSIRRYRMQEDTRLVLEATGPRLFERGGKLTTSTDGMQLVLLPDHADAEANRAAAYIYDPLELKSPLQTLPATLQPRAIAIGSISSGVYVCDRQHAVIRVPLQGPTEKVVPADPNDPVRQLFACPTKRRLLILTEKALTYVELKP